MSHRGRGAIMGMVLMLGVLVALEVLAFTGVWLALARPRWKLVLSALYWLVSLSLVAAVVGGSFLAPRDADGAPRMPALLVTAVVAVYLPKLVLATVSLLELLRRGLAWSARRLLSRGAAPAGWLTRARILPRLGVALALLLFGATLWSMTVSRTAVRVYRHTVLSADLPTELNGLRIAQLSDIHAASLGVEASRLADRLVQALNAEHPDLVVYTGDYGEPAEMEAGPDILGRLQGPAGKFAVLGNHDFGGRERAADNWASPADKQRKIDALAQAFRERGFTLLVNDAAVVSRGPGQLAVVGVGVYDPHHGFDDADLAVAERAVGAAPFRLLLAHSPEYWENAVQGRSDVDLTLTGHTHGAQLGLGLGSHAWSPAALVYPHWGGLYRLGRQYLNVNRGTGYWGLPLRLNMPAEVSIIELKSTT